jgi:hypothetical protein
LSPRTQVAGEETASYALAAILLALVVLAALPTVLGVLLATIAGGRGVLLTAGRHRTLARQRESADAVLATLPGDAVPEGLRWRAGEIGSVDHRRFVARQLHRFARMGDQRMLITAVPVHLETLRPNTHELDAIAHVVEQTDRPLPPRGLVLLEDLLRNGDESPLYQPASPEELGQALHDVHDALERRAA